MMNVVIGGFAFVMFILYDINSVLWKNKWLNKLFFLGFGILIASTSRLLFEFRDVIIENAKESIWGLGIAAIFMGLLVYTLFFALPFDKTYVEEHSEMKLKSDGIYALCRHPGVLWFTGLYIAIYFSIRQPLMLKATVIFSILNVAYVIFQDYWTFPKVFRGYDEYKVTTPFLIPNISSTRRLISQIRSRARREI